jgi:hypothetical protein
MAAGSFCLLSTSLDLFALLCPRFLLRLFSWLGLLSLMRLCLLVTACLLLAWCAAVSILS